MAIELKTVNKQADDRYSITVEDTDNQIDIDEKGNPIYRSYSVIYNPATGKKHLKAKIEELLKEDKALKTSEEQIMQDIKTTIEAIDSSKLEAK